MFQFSQGKFTTQGHKGIPEGFFEEEQGRKGFFGQVSHLIKSKPSTRWTNIEGPLKPRLYDLVEFQKSFGQWKRLFFNSEVVLYNYWLKVTSPDQAEGFRNADGDTLYFCHRGAGHVFTEYGLLSFKKGSYICVPKCITHTFLATDETQFLVIESRGSQYSEPDRGMLGRNAFYDQGAFGTPNLDEMQTLKSKLNINILNVTVRRSEQMTQFSYSECVYDTVGWKGDYFPFTLHIDDLMPINSHRVHLPPSVHSTFVARGFVVCTFLPRPLETDSDALKVPFYHQNIDYDEILFYHDGNFFSRDNLHAGMVTFHPAGFPHGPHPKAMKNISTRTHTDEVAVMVDTWQPLQFDSSLVGVEHAEYWKSWMTK